MKKLIPFLTILSLIVAHDIGVLARRTNTIEVGSFVLNNATGSQSVTTTNKPKAIIFFDTNLNTTNQVTDAGAFGFGITDCTNSAFKGLFGADGGLAAISGRYTQSNAVIYRKINVTPTVVIEATFTSCDSTGFTINITTSDTSQARIGYIIFAGDIQAFVGNWTRPNAAGQVTASGIGFTPTLVFELAGTTDVTALASTGNNTDIHFGAFNATQQWSSAITWNTANSSNGYQRTDNNIASMQANGAENDLCSFVSFAAGQFTVDCTVVDTDNEEPVYYLATRGITSFLGSGDQPTSNGTQTVSSLGFDPQAVIIASRNLVSGTTPTNQGKFSFGVSDVTNQVAGWTHASHGCGVGCAVARAFTTGDFIRMYTANGTGSSSTLNAAADLQSLGTGQFVLDWTTTDATARQYVFGAFKTNPEGGWMQNPILICCK